MLPRPSPPRRRSSRASFLPRSRPLARAPFAFGTERGLRSALCVLWVTALLGASGPLGCDRGPAPAERIVLVTIDTVRADRIGAYGDAKARTPHLDDLAARGARFDQAISPTPLTLPSHTSLMTGLQPPTHGVRHNSVFSLSEDIPVVAERMADAGFATAAFVGAFVLDARYGLGRGFQIYDDEMSQRLASRNPFSFAERSADAVMDAAIAWLAEAPDQFFLWVHLYDPHADYEPPRRYLQLAGGDAYAGEIAFSDAQVGRLLRSIAQRWGPEGLVVAVTSDHGESLGEHREPSHGYTIYDATQRIPLVLAGGQIPPGRVIDDPVRLVDLAPTLLELAGARPIEGIHGRSLLPLVRGETETRVAYVETLATQLDLGWSPLLGVRTRDHKYIRAPQPELYDLRSDPQETHNLALVEPERTRDLDAVLETHLEDARPLTASVELDDDERARLESLGYVVPTATTFGPQVGVVGGPNPRDQMQDVMNMQLARDALGAGRGKDALEILARVQTDGLQVVRTRAIAAIDADQPEHAIEVLEPLRTRGDAAVPDLTLLGMAYLAAGQLDEAREALEAARAADPKAHGPPVSLGLLALEQGDFEAADRWFAEGGSLAPQSDVGNFYRAIVRLHQGRTDDADLLLRDVDAGFLTDPTNALRLALAERRVGRTDRAAERLVRALDERPEHPRLLAVLATILDGEGRFDDALGHRQKLYALDPTDPGAINDLAWGLAMADRDLDRALDLAEEASRGLEDDPSVLDTLATVRFAREEFAATLDVADRALALEPDADVRRHLLYLRAAALDALGRKAEARRALETLRAEREELAEPWKGRAEQLSRRLGLEPTPAVAPAPERAGS